MIDASRTQFSAVEDDRDDRLSYAMDLLTVSTVRRRNGALPLIAVAGLALSGAMLATLAGGETPKAQKVEMPTVANAAPVADFELSGSSVTATSDVVMAGSEKDR